MADSFVRVPADDAGKRVDATSLDVGAATVYRQRIVIGDDSASAQFAVVTGGALTITGNINVSATATVIGRVALTAGTANIGNLDFISRTVQVAVGTPFTVNNISATVAAVLGAGTANIGSINNISATVAAVLAAGTANIGTLNGISATVTVAGVVGLTAGTAVIGDLNAISRTVQVAVGTPFTVNNISAAVVLAAGTANIGRINDISATVGITISPSVFVNVRHVSGLQANSSAGTAMTVKTAFASITAASQTVVAAVASARIRVLGYRMQAQGTTAARFNAGSSGANLSQLWSFQAREGTVVNAPPGCFEFESSAGEGITVAVSPTITVDVSVVYVEFT